MTARTLIDPPPGYRRELVRNQSSRNGRTPSAIAVHTTESLNVPGWNDLGSIRNWFNNLASDASSHIGVDREGHVELWVPSNRKAWTILVLNSVTLNIEFIGRAAQGRSEWSEKQLKEGAKWCAYWGKKYGIPMQRGNVRQLAGNTVISKKGIIKHSDLTAAGVGSHTDPGKNFPTARFLELCRYYRQHGYVA